MISLVHAGLEVPVETMSVSRWSRLFERDLEYNKPMHVFTKQCVYTHCELIFMSECWIVQCGMNIRTKSVINEASTGQIAHLDEHSACAHNDIHYAMLVMCCNSLTHADTVTLSDRCACHDHEVDRACISSVLLCRAHKTWLNKRVIELGAQQARHKARPSSMVRK